MGVSEVLLCPLTHPLADIDLIYGEDERQSKMGSYLFKVILGAGDTETQEYFAKLRGFKETVATSVSRNAQDSTNTKTESKVYVIEPAADLARLGDKLILLHPDDYIQLHKNFYFK